MDDALNEVERLVSESAERQRPSKNRRTVKPKEEAPVEDDIDLDEETEDAAPPKPRVRRVSRKAETVNLDEVTQEQVDNLLPPEAPEPEEKSRSLDDMYAKFGIGSRPEFKIQVHRTWPKMAPGGDKFDGYYDTWDMPLSMDEIQREYGGGHYLIVVVGPNPKSPNLSRRYASFNLDLPGRPKYERRPNAAKPNPAEVEASTSPVAIPPPVHVQENAKLSEQAMKLAFDVSERERDERRRAEEKAEARAAQAEGAMRPLLEAERRAAKVEVDAVRERAELERRLMQQQLDEQRQKQEELRREMEERMRSQPSVASELKALAETGLFGSKDEGATQKMVEQILERHQRELAMIHETHSKFIEALRSAHQTELQAIRDSQRRELEAEREAGRSREQRIEDRLASEREERRRDQEHEKKRLEERDLMWKDRMEQAIQMKEQSWESRHSSMLSAHEMRMMSLQSEIDRLKAELDATKHKVTDSSDPVAQMMKWREMQTVMKDVLDIKESAPATSGGIGIGGGGEDWKQALAEGVVERLPNILQFLGGQGGQASSQPVPQQQPQEGDLINTPQGPMVVVRDPATGQLALAPQAAVEAHRRAQAQQQQRGILPSGGGGANASRKRRPASRVARPVEKKRSVSVVPNLAEGLPRRAAPWEGGGEIDGPPPAPPPEPRMRSRPAVDPSGEPMELSAGERQALRMLAKEVNDHVLGGDDPEDMIQKLMANYPKPVLRQVVGQYTVSQIARGIVQVEPNGAGATPAGQKFVFQAFTELQRLLAEE